MTSDFALHQRAQLAVEFVAQQRRALDHFKTEQPRRIGPVARDHELAPDVVANGLARVLLGAEAAQRFEPQREQVAQHVDVQLFLVREVIEQVALRHVGARRHLVDRCAMQPEAREQPQRGTEDRAALVLDLAQPPAHGGRAAHRGFRSLARRVLLFLLSLLLLAAASALVFGIFPRFFWIPDSFDGERHACTSRTRKPLASNGAPL
jgi:hypothetical protein